VITAELRHSADQLTAAGRALYDLGEAALWERETATLPRPLARRRRQYRAFAREHLAPLVDRADADPTSHDPRPLLTAAARAGLQSEMLPPPWGTMPLSSLRSRSLVHEVLEGRGRSPTVSRRPGAGAARARPRHLAAGPLRRPRDDPALAGPGDPREQGGPPTAGRVRDHRAGRRLGRRGLRGRGDRALPHHGPPRRRWLPPQRPEGLHHRGRARRPRDGVRHLAGRGRHPGTRRPRLDLLRRGARYAGLPCRAQRAQAGPAGRGRHRAVPRRRLGPGREPGGCGALWLGAQPQRLELLARPRRGDRARHRAWCDRGGDRVLPAYPAREQAAAGLPGGAAGGRRPVARDDGDAGDGVARVAARARRPRPCRAR